MNVVWLGTGRHSVGPFFIVNPIWKLPIHFFLQYHMTRIVSTKRMHRFLWISILLLSANMACSFQTFALRHSSLSRLCTTTTTTTIGRFSIMGASTRHDNNNNNNNARPPWRLFSILKKRVVFLGTPEVAADSLKLIYEDSIRKDSPYEIVGVVTQPPKRRKRMGEIVASPVGALAETLGIAVLAPESVSLPYQYIFIF